MNMVQIESKNKTCTFSSESVFVMCTCKHTHTPNILMWQNKRSPPKITLLPSTLWDRRLYRSPLRSESSQTRLGVRTSLCTSSSCDLQHKFIQVQQRLHNNFYVFMDVVGLLNMLWMNYHLTAPTKLLQQRLSDSLWRRRCCCKFNSPYPASW